MTTKHKAYFSLSQNEERYNFYVLTDKTRVIDLPEHLLEIVVEEANRFINFYMVDPGEYHSSMNPLRKVSSNFNDQIPKFSMDQITLLKHGEIAVAGGFELTLHKIV